jgi:hypothetical protein
MRKPPAPKVTKPRAPRKSDAKSSTKRKAENAGEEEMEHDIDFVDTAAEQRQREGGLLRRRVQLMRSEQCLRQPYSAQSWYGFGGQ